MVNSPLPLRRRQDTDSSHLLNHVDKMRDCLEREDASGFDAEFSATRDETLLVMHAQAFGTLRHQFLSELLRHMEALRLNRESTKWERRRKILGYLTLILQRTAAGGCYLEPS